MNTPLAWWDEHTTSPRYTNSTPASRDCKRRSTLISRYILLCLTLQVVALPFEVILNIFALQTSLLLAAPMYLVALFFNRRGNIITSGILCIAITIFAIAAPFVHGIAITSLPVFSLLAIPLIVSCAALPPEWVFVHFFLNLVLITLGLFSPLNDHVVQSYVRQDLYATFAPHVALQVCVTVMAYMVVKNLIRAMQRADRAEDSARFQRAVARQEHILAEQKEQLEQVLHYVVDMNNRAADGTFTPLLPASEDPALLQLTEAINSSLARLQRFQQDSADFQTLRSAIANLVARMQQARQTQQPFVLPDVVSPGSLLEPLIEELTSSYRSLVEHQTVRADDSLRHSP